MRAENTAILRGLSGALGTLRVLGAGLGAGVGGVGDGQDHGGGKQEDKGELHFFEGLIKR